MNWIAFLLAAFLVLGLIGGGDRKSGPRAHLLALVVVVVTLAVIWPRLGH